MSFKAPESLAEQIAQHIGKKIITGELASKERIQELKVAKELEVSRGSVREALLILEGRHLIDILPRRGAMVSELTPEKVTALYEFYITLLTMLSHKLADLWTDGDEQPLLETYKQMQKQSKTGTDNVEAIVESSFDLMRLCFPIVKNPYLEETLEKLQSAVHRTYYQTMREKPEEVEKSIDFFTHLVEAVIKRNKVAITNTIQGYGQHTLATILSGLS